MMDTPMVEVRLARPADAETICSVLYAAFAGFRPLYTKAAFDATVLSPARVVERMMQGPVWVAETAAGIVGTVGVVQRDDALYVRGMAVAPEAQGQRIGSALLNKVEEFARASDHTRLELSTAHFLTSARRLYERHQFQLCAAEENFHGTPVLAMKKTLSAAPP